MIEENQLKILRKIRENSRKSLSLISREISLKVPEIYLVLNELYQDGFIKRFTSILNHSNMGYGFNVLFNIKIDSIEKFRKYINSNNNVNNAFLLSDSYGYVQCIFKSLTDIERYKEELESMSFIKSFSEHYVLETIRNEEFFC
jgi:Lrp/AsnC family transcriptional regulator, leucine-responsive regulatory protein